jgi:hypothetical protein
MTQALGALGILLVERLMLLEVEEEIQAQGAALAAALGALGIFHLIIIGPLLAPLVELRSIRITIFLYHRLALPLLLVALHLRPYHCLREAMSTRAISKSVLIAGII